ncbi:DUF2399 domain-containing protein [Frankia gtarii]|uniref:DUF2399 domain-containing protein n=1 Tax=Frankia gtarii TaxID=2950102 RepID=UPI0034D4B9F6
MALVSPTGAGGRPRAGRGSPGLAIANTVIDRYDAVPWRYDRAHYKAALRPGFGASTGRPVRTRFDPDLADRRPSTP